MYENAAGGYFGGIFCIHTAAIDQYLCGMCLQV